MDQKPQPKQAPATSTTMPADVNKKVLGYIINADLSAKGQEAIFGIQRRLSSQFPDAFWATPPESLHITLLDLLTPVVTYAWRYSCAIHHSR
jgi:hypothetical protein